MTARLVCEYLSFRYRDYLIFWCGLFHGHTRTGEQTTTQGWLADLSTDRFAVLLGTGRILSRLTHLFSALCWRGCRSYRSLNYRYHHSESARDFSFSLIATGHDLIYDPPISPFKKLSKKLRKQRRPRFQPLRGTTNHVAQSFQILPVDLKWSMRLLIISFKSCVATSSATARGSAPSRESWLLIRRRVEWRRLYSSNDL